MVSRICLGTMMFGDRTERGEAGAIVDTYAEAGGNFLDTADTYAGGASETMLGRLIEGRRDRFVLATKVGNPMPGQPGTGGQSARYIRQALAASLDRLGVDAVDLLYLHRDDETTPLEETVVALGQAIADGQTRHWGLSNIRAWKVAELVRLCDREGVPRPVALQPYYHALYREAERELLPVCQHYGIGVVSYSPLARGVLTGKYRDGVPAGSRGARGDVRIGETEMRPANLDAARALDEHVRPSGRDTGHVALRWVLASAIVTSVLAGPRTMAQLSGYLAAFDTAYTREDESFVEDLVPAGCSAGSTYFDPRYPFRGRVVDLP